MFSIIYFKSFLFKYNNVFLGFYSKIYVFTTMTMTHTHTISRIINTECSELPWDG